MTFRHLSIRAKLFGLIAISAIGFAAFVAIVWVQMKPDDDAFMMKDIVADVLPPPKYIVESYTYLLQMSHESDAVAREELVKAWNGNKAAFEERQVYWDSTLVEGPLKQWLQRDSTTPAREFFAIGDREFIPAARAGDETKMHQLLVGSLRDAYLRHRAAIDEVVKIANKEAAAFIAATEESFHSRKVRLALIGLAIVMVCVVIGAVTSRSINRRVRATVTMLDAVAAGDLTPRIHDDSRDDLGMMARALNSALDSMVRALSEAEAVSVSLTAAARELASNADSIATGASAQAASLEETSASLEEITSTVRQSSDNAQEASQLASRSRESAERGGDVVTQANSAMGQIHDASDRISNIITTIDEIAFQTNILALNAAVEAARAGEQGRGFAVVAAQVGTLSQRSSEAAKEIKTLIQDSVRKVASGSELVSRSGTSLREIVKSVTSVTDLVGEMAGAFREQSSGLQQISTAIAQIDNVMQSTTAQTDEMSSTAASLTSHAEHLRDVLSRFRLEAGRAPERTAPPPSRQPAAGIPFPTVRAVRGQVTEVNGKHLNGHAVASSVDAMDRAMQSARREG